MSSEVFSDLSLVKPLDVLAMAGHGPNAYLFQPYRSTPDATNFDYVWRLSSVFQPKMERYSYAETLKKANLLMSEANLWIRDTFPSLESIVTDYQKVQLMDFASTATINRVQGNNTVALELPRNQRPIIYGDIEKYLVSPEDLLWNVKFSAPSALSCTFFSRKDGKSLQDRHLYIAE